MDSHFNYAQEKLDDVKKLISSNLEGGLWGTGYQSVIYRIHEQPVQTVVHYFSVEIWPSQQEANCTCSIRTYLCPHIAFVLAENWQTLHEVAKPFLPPYNPVPVAPPVAVLDKLYTQFNRMVVADLVALYQKYQDPNFRKHWGI